VQRILLRAKIHRCIVSEADPDYVGSMTVPYELMRELDILEGEQVDVANIANGNRWTTYVIGTDKPGYFGLNGAAARLGKPGDLLILMIYGLYSEEEARTHKARIAFMGPGNKVERIQK